MATKGKGKGKSKAEAMAKRPEAAISYLCCPNVSSCTMAAKQKSWIWDFGVGTKTDTITCKECAYHFAKQRGSISEAHASNSSNNIKGAWRGWGRGGNHTPPKPPSTINPGLLELDMTVLFEKLKVCKSTQELTSSLKDLCTPKPKVLTPSEEMLKLGRFIKHNEMRELQIFNQLDNLKAGICEATKTLIEVQASLKVARVKHDLCLESLKTKQVQVEQHDQAMPEDVDHHMHVDHQDPMDLGQEDKLALIQKLTISLNQGGVLGNGTSSEIIEEAGTSNFEPFCPYDTDFPGFGKADTVFAARPAPYVLDLPPIREERGVLDNVAEVLEDELDRAEIMSETDNLSNLGSNFGTPINTAISPEAYAALSQRAQLALSSEMYGIGGTARPEASSSSSGTDVAEAITTVSDGSGSTALAPALAPATGEQHF